jgi:hypothetical protein
MTQDELHEGRVKNAWDTFHNWTFDGAVKDTDNWWVNEPDHYSLGVYLERNGPSKRVALHVYFKKNSPEILDVVEL